MAGRRKKKIERPVFDSIRKPVAPPTKEFGTQKPESTAHPAARKIKHKKKIETEEA
jgi:hypothetical protein